MMTTEKQTNCDSADWKYLSEKIMSTMKIKI